MAGKQWMQTRAGRGALAALAWTILGCVFALPDLAAAMTGATLCFCLLHYGGPGVWSHLSSFGWTGRYPFLTGNLRNEFWRISFRVLW